MINIQLYRNYSDNNYVSKDIRPIAGGELTARAPHEVSIIAPVLTFDYNTAFLLANYAYISEFGRYYFIKNIITDTAKRVHLELSVDPLMSFASQIRQCSATVIRYARKKDGKAGATKVVDTRYPIIPNKLDILSTIAVNNGLINGYTDGHGYNYKNYALTVLNGGVTI